MSRILDTVYAGLQAAAEASGPTPAAWIRPTAESERADWGGSKPPGTLVEGFAGHVAGVGSGE